jgi:hypothetical protein
MSPKKAQPSSPTPKSDARRPNDAPTAAEDELDVEVLEARIAPRLALNHNETLLADA